MTTVAMKRLFSVDFAQKLLVYCQASSDTISNNEDIF